MKIAKLAILTLASALSLNVLADVLLVLLVPKLRTAQ